MFRKHNIGLDVRKLSCWVLQTTNAQTSLRIRSDLEITQLHQTRPSAAVAQVRCLLGPKWRVTNPMRFENMQQFQLKNVKIAMKHRGEKRKFTGFYLVSLSFNTEVELLMKKGNQSTKTVSILIVQLRFKRKTKKPSVALSGPPWVLCRLKMCKTAVVCFFYFNR